MSYKRTKPDGTKNAPPPPPASVARIGGTLADGTHFEAGHCFAEDDVSPDERRTLIKLGVIDPEHPTNPELPAEDGADTEGDD